MAVFIAVVVAVLALSIGLPLWWSVRRAKSQRAAQERDWTPLASELAGTLERAHGTFRHHVLRGRAHGVPIEAAISHVVEVDKEMAGKFFHNNTYRTQVHATRAAPGPRFVLVAARAGKGRAQVGSDALRGLYTIEHAQGDVAGVLDAATDAALVAAHPTLFANGIDIVTGGRVVTALFGRAPTDTALMRTVIDLVGRLAARG